MNNSIVKIKILDEVYVLIVGLQPNHIEWFVNKYSIFAENYFFNPLYKLGRWSGKIKFFGKDGKTYLYLLNQLLPDIKNLGYTLQLEDLRQTEAYYPEPITTDIFSHISHLDTNNPIKLRDYQVDAVNAVLQDGNGIILASTSAGKTFITAAICTVYGNLGLKTLTIVPNRDLIRQTKADYDNFLLDTGEYSGKHKTLNHQHIVSTWQALKNNPLLITTFQVVIVDECHGAKGPTLSKILTEHAGSIPHRFGVTGTLPKDPCDLMAVHLALGQVKYTILAHTLMNEGVLSTIQIDILQLEEDLTKEYDTWCKEECISIGRKPTYKEFKDGYFGDFDSERSYIRRKENRIEWIADLLLTKLDKSGNVLCLVDNIPFGRRIAALIPNSIFINGKDVRDPIKRQKVYDLFKTRDDLIVIATVNIAGTGLSINRIFNLITIDIGKSFIRVIQAIGRGLRKADDKSHVSYTDICSDLKYGKKHVTERIKFYKEARYPYKKYKVEYNKEQIKEIK